MKTVISDMPTGAQLILDERRRQIEKEGWTSEHDDQHSNGELASAAVAYADFPLMTMSPQSWPFEESWWKPSTDKIRNLVKAGALIAAEIDRLQRLGK